MQKNLLILHNRLRITTKMISFHSPFWCSSNAGLTYKHIYFNRKMEENFDVIILGGASGLIAGIYSSIAKLKISQMV